METYTAVRPEHLNSYGALFGGQLLKWVDEYAWMAAARDYPGQRLVTRAMDKAEFRTSVPCGSIVRFQIGRTRVGSTSVCYQVRVFALHPDHGPEFEVFGTHVTFVCVDPGGHKTPLPPG